MSHTPGDRELPCRLLIDASASGAWQMAVDEVMLESAAEAGICSLRFYRWAEPTLSLGYFQRYDDRMLHPASGSCPVVRRQTGGGAILHDQELTYSLAMPVAHPLAADAMQLYRAVHEALVAALAGFGVSARLAMDASDGPERRQPFLCFERRGAGDVLMHGAKICGSAQRRRRGAILQHGSLLLAQSQHAPDLPGIYELCGKRVPERGFVEGAARDIASAVGFNLAAQALAASELESVRALALEKYDLASWTKRR